MDGPAIVSLNAERGVDASTARMLQGLGWPEWVANDEDGYVQRALQFMDGPDRLTALRHATRAQLQRSVLMDYAARTCELEVAYRLMWLNYLRGNRQSRSVADDLPAQFAAMEAPA